MDIAQEGTRHGDVWDDSTLIDSWNEALDEYKVTDPWLDIIRNDGLV